MLRSTFSLSKNSSTPYTRDSFPPHTKEFDLAGPHTPAADSPGNARYHISYVPQYRNVWPHANLCITGNAGTLAIRMAEWTHWYRSLRGYQSPLRESTE